MADVLVVGGGIGGLSLARELSLRGLRATVLEKAPQLNPVGAGIIMNPNAMRDYRPLYDAGKLARGHVFGDFAPVYMGYRSHRMVVENTGVAHFTEFLGHGRRIGLVPISEKRLYVWTTFNLPHNGPPGPERVARVLSQLRSMEGVIPTAIEELACRLRNRRIRRQGRNVEQALDELERLLAHPS